jgi:Ca2+-dependent lipid-binding protein
LIPRIRFNLSYFPIDFRNAKSKLALKVPAILEIKLLKATGLMAVNAGVKTSDPYFCIEINNRRLYKSSEYQKQLDPILTNEPVIGVLLNTADLDTLMILIRDYNQFGIVSFVSYC